MTKIIIPTTIVLDTNIVEVKSQYLKEQKSSPVILFGEKYMLNSFVVKDSQYPDLRKAVIKLTRIRDDNNV